MGPGTVDQRDDLTWIAIELTRYGEQRVEEGTLAEAIRQDLEVDENYPIFIPSTVYQKGFRRVTLHLMEGYVFVASGLPETKFFALERRPYVNQVMSTAGGPYQIRVPSVIPNSRIEELREKLRGLVASDIEVDSQVRVVDGAYKGLEGEVLGLDGDSAFVHVELRSLKIIATIPKVFLESDEP